MLLLLLNVMLLLLLNKRLLKLLLLLLLRRSGSSKYCGWSCGRLKCHCPLLLLVLADRCRLDYLLGGRLYDLEHLLLARPSMMAYNGDLKMGDRNSGDCLSSRNTT